MVQIIPVNQVMACEPTLKSIYHDSFPPDERREWHELLELIYHSDFNFYCITNNTDPVGLITLWEWAEFTFIEHFAIDKTFRAQGIGSEVINQLKKEKSTKIILETEEPTTDLATRRIAFYTSLGFQTCEEEYYQPPYSKDKKAVKMLLMNYPDKIAKTEFTTIRSKLYKEVYQINNSEYPFG